MAATRRRVKYKAPKAQTPLVEVSAQQVANTAALAKRDALPAFLSIYPEVMTPDQVATALQRKKRSILDDQKLARARLKNMPKVTVRFNRDQIAAMTMGFAVLLPPELARQWTSQVLVDSVGAARQHVAGAALARFLRIRSLSEIANVRPRPPVAKHIHAPRHRYTPGEVLSFMLAVLTTTND